MFYQEHVLTQNKGWLLWHIKMHVGISLMLEFNTLYWYNPKALEILQHKEAQGLEVIRPDFINQANEEHWMSGMTKQRAP